MSDSNTGGNEQFECVVCGSDSHDGDGWIFPSEDAEIVAIGPNGVERELKENPRAICSIDCKDEFENRSLETDTEQ